MTVITTCNRGQSITMLYGDSIQIVELGWRNNRIMNNRILLGWKIVGCINCRNFRRNRRNCYHFVIPIPYIITD